MGSALSEIVNLHTLRRMAGSRSFDRGEDYFVRGRVRSLFLMTRLGREAEFARYLESVRTTYKRKRNLMKLIERETWK